MVEMEEQVVEDHRAVFQVKDGALIYPNPGVEVFLTKVHTFGDVA